MYWAGLPHSLVRIYLFNNNKDIKGLDAYITVPLSEYVNWK